ncbi:hypothetical protein Q5P01_000115 [Channa striata]|uniref:Uncharacterized protein n=1 Tax=Channa striata TaxID=64152 RepID=A0AA88LMS5_CHASR|nr:hypothetical protein Q5P01_000115 [Channa striata]
MHRQEAGRETRGPCKPEGTRVSQPTRCSPDPERRWLRPVMLVYDRPTPPQPYLTQVDYGQARRASKPHQDQPQQAAAFLMHQDTSLTTTIEHPPPGQETGPAAASCCLPDSARGQEDCRTAASTTLQAGCSHH